MSDRRSSPIIIHEGDEPDPFAHLFDADVLTAGVVAAMLSKLVSLVKNFDSARRR